MTTLAAQNHKIRQEEARSKRKDRLIRIATVTIGLALFLTIASINTEAKCVDQGQPISCSLIN